AAESLQRLPVLGHILRQELQSDEAVKPGVLGLVNDAHASAAELLDDAVMRDNLANHSFPPHRAEILRLAFGQVNRLDRAANSLGFTSKAAFLISRGSAGPSPGCRWATQFQPAHRRFSS